MFPRSAALVVLALIAPIVAASVHTSGTFPPAPLPATDIPNGPQVYCEIVQSEPVPSTNPYRCSATGNGMGITLIRARIVGTGHARAWADYGSGSQTRFLDCYSNPATLYYKMCSGIANQQGTSPLSTTFTLNVLVDGPGGAVYSIWLEDAKQTLP